MKQIILFLFFFIPVVVQAQHKLTGIVQLNGAVVKDAHISIKETMKATATNDEGAFSLDSLEDGRYELLITKQGLQTLSKSIRINGKDINVTVKLDPNENQLTEVTIMDHSEQAAGKLNQVEGTSIYAGKKTEVINIGNINANLATNNARQVYGRVVGLNIWEYDGGGLQLGIGGRGLNPSRVSNFNTRQNGYDISADALGYPESYYSPSTEAVDRIEIIRGAASLQYGTQFGGLINFKMKKGPLDKPFELVSRQTVGSFGFVNSFNSIGGTKGKFNYYAFVQYKRADSWRPNSHFDQQAAYAHLDYAATKKLKVSFEYTYMYYLAQQPGGLTDADFNNDASISVRDRNWFKVHWNLASLSLDYQLGEHTKLNWRNYNLRAGRDALGILSYINRPDPGGPRDLLSDTYENYGSELRVLHQYKFLSKMSHTWLTGVRVYKGLTLRSQGDADAGKGADFNFLGYEPNKSDYSFPGLNTAVFTENIFAISSRWTVTPGARFEYISTKADGYYYKVMKFVPNVKMNEQKENNRSFVLFGIGTSYKLKPGVELYANISQNYRSINFNDLRVINDNARVDSLLKDETGYTADGGIRGNVSSWLYYDLSVFFLKYNDRIGSIFAKDADNMVYRLRTNVSDSRNIGFESLIEADLLKAITKGRARYKLSAYVNFAYTNARYINTQDAAILNKEVEYVPPVLLRGGLSFGNKKFNVSGQYSYVGKQYSDATNAEFTPTAVDGAVPAYQVLDLNASYTWRWLTLYGSINNLANAKYFTRRADGYPGPGIIPSDKRSFYLTVQVKI